MSTVVPTLAQAIRAAQADARASVQADLADPHSAVHRFDIHYNSVPERARQLRSAMVRRYEYHFHRSLTTQDRAPTWLLNSNNEMYLTRAAVGIDRAFWDQSTADLRWSIEYRDGLLDMYHALHALAANGTVSAVRALVQTMSDALLARCIQVAAKPNEYILIESPAIRLLQEEQQRRDDNLDRRHFAQSNMPAVIEARPVRGFGFGLGAAMATLVGTFLHNVGTANQGHPSALPRVEPHWGPAAPYALPAPPAPDAVGAARKAPDEPASSSKHRRLNEDE